MVLLIARTLGKRPVSPNFSALDKQVVQDLTLNRTYPKIQPWVYGYDAYAVVEEAYAENPF